MMWRMAWFGVSGCTIPGRTVACIISSVIIESLERSLGYHKGSSVGGDSKKMKTIGGVCQTSQESELICML